MKLTRERAIAEFRKEWNYIADVIERVKKVIDVSSYKFEYCYENKFYVVKNDCFLCEYVRNGSFDWKCDKCPIEWPSNFGGFPCEGECWEDNKERFGLWWKCKNAETWQEQAALARQIANLPERKDV